MDEYLSSLETNESVDDSVGDVPALLQPQTSLALLGVAALLFGPIICFCRTRLQAWVDRQPWWEAGWRIMQHSMMTMGFAKENAARPVCLQFYCTLIIFSTYHLVCASFMMPVFIFGWEGDELGQNLFALGIIMDAALTVYDQIALTIRFCFPTTCTFLGNETPMALFVITCVLHHPVVLSMSMPMLWFYPDMRAYHIIAVSMLISAGGLTGMVALRTTFNIKEKSEYCKFKVLTVFGGIVGWSNRGFIWFWQAFIVLRTFYNDGAMIFFVVGCITSFLMSGFSLMIMIESADSIWKHVLCPRQQELEGPQVDGDGELGLVRQELEGPQIDGDGERGFVRKMRSGSHFIG